MFSWRNGHERTEGGSVAADFSRQNKGLDIYQVFSRHALKPKPCAYACQATSAFCLCFSCRFFAMIIIIIRTGENVAMLAIAG
jgi:hypothetical protein